MKGIKNTFGFSPNDDIGAAKKMNISANIR